MMNDNDLSRLQRLINDHGEFIYAVSHDLRAPILSITGLVDLLLADPQNFNEQQCEDLGFIKSEAERLNRLIDNLSIYSEVDVKLESFREIDPRRLVGDVVKTLDAAIQQSGAHINIDPLPLQIRGDRDSLYRVFQNLIDNAMKFTEGAPTVRVSGTTEDGTHRFRVADNGIGIPDQYLKKIFVIFQRLGRVEEYEGTGMGLAICQKIIHQHGGTIWAESKSGVGTTFYFTIPELETPVE